MKALLSTSKSDVLIEIGQAAIQALCGEAGWQAPLQRSENGRLDPACRKQVVESLLAWVRDRQVRPGQQALCAIGARGVSLRRMKVPSGAKDELQRILRLQIEREFPLTPDELAWGYRVLNGLSGNGGGSKEVLVVAVRKDVIDEYAALLAECHLAPVFTLAALVRTACCPEVPERFSILDVQEECSELVSFDHREAEAIRILPWGARDLARTNVDAVLSTSTPAALGFAPKELRPGAPPALSIPESMQTGKVYVGGLIGAEFAAGDGRLMRTLRSSVPCEMLSVGQGPGRTAALLGLRQTLARGESVPLVLQAQVERKPAVVAKAPLPWKWAVLAALLFVALIGFRSFADSLQKARLQKEVDQLRTRRAALPKADPELLFLQYLKTNQARYLDPLTAVANAAPAGTKIENLSMSRRGDLTLRAMMREGQQAVDFRSKLIDSGLFSTLVIEEQTPSPDRQKLTLRMSGHWQPTREWTPPPTPDKSGPPKRESVAKTNAPKAQAAAPAGQGAPATNDGAGSKR